nr:hypothetical protein [Tanacetum cinerariifolium]
MKEIEVMAIKEIENPLNERKMQTQDGMINKDMKMLTQEGLVNKGITLDASLASKESIDDNPTSTEQQDERARHFDRDMDLNRGKEERDDVDNEKERVVFASLVNNLKCEVENCTKIKLLNEEISNLKSQVCQKEKTFIRENVKYDDQGIKPSMYDVDKMGQDLSAYHKIISKEELESETEKRLKVKQTKSPLSYQGFVYGLTQFVEPPRVPLKRIEANLKKRLEQAQVAYYDPKLWKSSNEIFLLCQAFNA